MIRTFLKAKIRDIRLTGTNFEYQGSITLDENYLEQSGILPHEQVQVLNLENGSRLITYALKGERGSGVVELNGPAARSGLKGDRVMVLTYCMLNETEISGHNPVVISVNPSKPSV